MKHNHRISVETGRALIERHQRHELKRENDARVAKAEFKRQPFAHVFDLDQVVEFALEAKAKGATGLRRYLAMKEDGIQTMVEAAVDAKGQIVGETMLDLSFPCPPTCEPPTWA